MKKTKIVGTIGPASESEEILTKLFESGLNVCRLNFSHGSHEEHKVRIDTIKRVRERLNLPIAILLDTKGPEVRLREFEEGIIFLSEGDPFTFTTREVMGNQTICSVSYPGLARDVSVGDRILVDDGLVQFEVVDLLNGTDIVCRTLNAGELKNRKSINIPHVKNSTPCGFKERS